MGLDLANIHKSPNSRRKKISNTLHMSQSTISKDINNIYQDKKKDSKKYGNELFLDVQNTLAGLAELIKKSWTIVDDPKAEQKERMKAISVILQYYGKRLVVKHRTPCNWAQRIYRFSRES